MNIVLYTLGCKVNQCESEQIIAQFISRGYSATNKLVAATCYIINTCSVTAEAERKSRQLCHKALSLNNRATVFVFGCAVENYKRVNNSDTFAGATIVVGTDNKLQVVDKVLDYCRANNIAFDVDNTIAKMTKSLTTDSKTAANSDVACHYDRGTIEDIGTNKGISTRVRTRQYIKIQDGCDNYCTYCIIPYLRGKSTSIDIESIVGDIKSTNALETVLTGIDISSYGLDIGTSLYELIDNIDTTKSRVRLGSIECGVITKQLLLLMKSKNICDHFHLSMQSASNNVLSAMNRRYTIDEFIAKVELIREVFGDNTGITTDIIAGFPTESNSDFEETVNNLHRIGFSDMHIFQFSRRKGTVAAGYKELDSAVVAQRMQVLQQVRSKYKTEFLVRQIGKVHDVYFESYRAGLARGYSTNYCLTATHEHNTKCIKSVKITDIKDDILIGEVING